MKCDICKKPNPELLIILPIHQADGRLDTIACEKCAKESKAYCKKHRRPHQGFIDGTTACLQCIEELVKVNKDDATSIRDRVREALPRDQVEDLNDAAEISAEVTGSSESIAVLRFIASKAMRSNQTIEEVINEITESHSVDYILWR